MPSNFAPLQWLRPRKWWYPVAGAAAFVLYPGGLDERLIAAIYALLGVLLVRNSGWKPSSGIPSRPSPDPADPDRQEAPSSPPRPLDLSSRYRVEFFGRLPWPMTVNESLVYLACRGAAVPVVLGGWVAAFYLSTAAFEPSLWRLLPLVLWPFLFRFAWRRIVPWFEPKDSVQRWLALT